MPRTATISKKDIIDAAIELIRKNGHEAVNARALACKLRCSTQPVFSNFRNMDDLMQSVLKATLDIYNSFVSDFIRSGLYEPQYKAYGRAYIKFALEEKNLFKLLFMRDRTNDPRPIEESTFYDVLPLIMEATGLDEKRAAMFHFEMWSSVHGIAAMGATSYWELDMELVSQTLTDVYQGVLYRFKQKEGSDEERN